MTDFLPDVSWQVLRSTMFLSVAAVVASAGLKLLKARSPRTGAQAWSMVLLAGVLVVPATLEIPWYAPVPAVQVSTDRMSIGVVDTGTHLLAPRTPLPAQTTDTLVRATAVAAEPAPPTMFRWTTASSVMWLTGMAAIGGVALAGYVGLLLALKSSWQPHRLWQREYAAAAEQLGVARPPKMVVHARLGPMLCLTPAGYRLVIPSDQWSQLSCGERDVVLKHELAHYLRSDVWRSIPLRLVVLLHWFNPLAWLAAARIDEAAEWESDRIALQNQPEGTGLLANALLKLARTTVRSRLLAPAARGRSLTRRLQNLIRETEQTGAEPMLKKMTIVLALAGILVAGAVQIRLVAQEDEAERQSQRSRISAATAKEFADRLVGDDDLTSQLKEAVQSEPGALVLRDRAGHYEEQARDELRSNMLPSLLEEWFEKTAAGLKLRSGSEAFRAEFLTAAEEHNIDIEGMKQVLRELASQMDMDTDLDRLVHRFLMDDGAPVILYASELRPGLRPGAQIIDRVFQEVFALRRDGHYEIRADGRARAEQMAGKFRERSGLVELLIRDVAELADEIAEVDDFHKSVKVALKDPLLVTRLGLELFERKQAGRGQVDQMVDHLDGAFRDVADGLVVRDEARPDIEERLQIRERLTESVISLRGPLNEFSDKISDHDELHRTWKQMLKTDIMLIRVASEMEYATADLGDVIREFFGRILAEKDNGRLHVQPPEINEEELAEHISHMFHQYRSARRRGRQLDELVDTLLDADLKQALQTPGGKLTFGDHLKRRMNAEVQDGFAEWISDHFEEINGGYAIREEAREEITEVIHQIAEVKKELENADF
ncbi:MAG: M56 family metallopeptidase [Fuerstiella sp.]